MSQSSQVLHPGCRTAITIAFFPRWIATLMRTHERWRQRQDLRELEDHLLRDVGITREQAQYEASKPFWE